MAKQRTQLNGKTDGKPGRPPTACDCDGLSGADYDACMVACFRAATEARSMITSKGCGCNTKEQTIDQSASDPT